MPELLQSMVDANPVLWEARDRYELSAGLPQTEIIEEGILVETTAGFYRGEEYAVRNYLSPEIAQADFAVRLPALELCLGHRGLEQLVAFSPEEGVLVTKRGPGRSIIAIGLEETAAMTKQQFKDMASAVEFATRAGIEINLELEPTSLLYDQIEGFSFADYALADEPSTYRTIKGIGQAMMQFGYNLPTFYSRDSIRRREKIIRMVTQSGLSILPQSAGRALIEASNEWIDRCWSGDVIVDAESNFSPPHL